MDLACGDPRSVHGHTDEGFVGVRGAPLTSICEKTHPVCLQAIGDPHFAACEIVVSSQ